jgi:hypothetical protein
MLGAVFANASLWAAKTTVLLMALQAIVAKKDASNPTRGLWKKIVDAKVPRVGRSPVKEWVAVGEKNRVAVKERRRSAAIQCKHACLLTNREIAVVRWGRLHYETYNPLAHTKYSNKSTT